VEVYGGLPARVLPGFCTGGHASSQCRPSPVGSLCGEILGVWEDGAHTSCPGARLGSSREVEPETMMVGHVMECPCPAVQVLPQRLAKFVLQALLLGCVVAK